MKYTVINGCPENGALTAATLERVRENLPNASRVNLAETTLKPCAGCDACQAVHPGTCGIKDSQNDVLFQFLNSDAVVVVTPVRFGCCNALTKNFMDRTQPLFLPFQAAKHGRSIMKPRYEKFPDQIWLGIMENDNDEDEAVFETFIQNSNLAAASHYVSVTTVKNTAALDTVTKLLTAGRN